MVDNEQNTFNAAPDKGILNGPVTGPIKMSFLKAAAHAKKLQKRETSDFWIDELQHGMLVEPWRACYFLLGSKYQHQYIDPICLGQL